MKWLRHDTNSSMNRKLAGLRVKFGAEGLGVYWYCLEIIAHFLTPENLSFELKHDIEVMADLLKIDKKKYQEILDYMISVDLFQRDSDGRVFCFALAERADSSTSKNPQFQKMQESIRGSGIYDGVDPKNAEQRMNDLKKLEEKLRKIQ